MEDIKEAKNEFEKEMDSDEFLETMHEIDALVYLKKDRIDDVSREDIEDIIWEMQEEIGMTVEMLKDVEEPDEKAVYLKQYEMGVD